MNVTLIVGSSNKTKIHAAQDAVQTKHPEAFICTKAFECDPNIEPWKSQLSKGQPYGVKQTALGAIYRAVDAYKQYLNQQTSDLNAQPVGLLISCAFENGKIGPSEVDQERHTQQWFDVVYSALYDPISQDVLVKRGKYVKTEFKAPEDASQEIFDQHVQEDQALIMPKIRHGLDLIRGWTNGKHSRSSLSEQCLSILLLERDCLQVCKRVADDCATQGMQASSGNRYKDTLWTRDLAINAPVFLQCGFITQFQEALDTIVANQKTESKMIFNGYEQLNTLGQIPIVCIPRGREWHFVHQRLVGTPEDPFWQLQLYDYCKRHTSPELFKQFPLGDTVSPLDQQSTNNSKGQVPNLKSLTIVQLRGYYEDLLVYQQRIIKYAEEHKIDEPVPRPSFALAQYTKGQLHQVTSGTRDSEIQFCRAVFQLVDHMNKNNNTNNDKMSNESRDILKRFAPALARALIYVLLNVVDPLDGLPRGADSRDIFADLLYDAKLLSNAVFWYICLVWFLKYARFLHTQTDFSRVLVDSLSQVNKSKSMPMSLSILQTSLGMGQHGSGPSLDDLIQQIRNNNKNKNSNNNKVESTKQPNSTDKQDAKDEQELDQMCADSILFDFFEREVCELRFNIYQRFFNQSDGTVRDFIPGQRAQLGLVKPIEPTPVLDLIKKHNPDFVNGSQTDPQGLAHAVLNGLVDPQNYDQCVDLFMECDSDIGIAVFVPISSKSESERHILDQAKGRVVWSHISWLVVRALLYMNTKKSLHYAEQQRDKLVSMLSSSTSPMCSEWYAQLDQCAQIYAGGEQQQGWSATGFLMAMQSFAQYYTESKPFN